MNRNDRQTGLRGSVHDRQGPTEQQKSRSSFKRLLNYLTKEVDPETERLCFEAKPYVEQPCWYRHSGSGDESRRIPKPTLRRCSLPLRTGVAPRRTANSPTMDGCAEYTLDQLGYKDHSTLSLLTTTRAFHIHIMLNRVHPETYKAYAVSELDHA